MSHHQTTEQNHYLIVTNKSFGNEAEVQVFWNDVMNQNYIDKEINNVLNVKNATT
jgi:hypothetical protein